MASSFEASIGDWEEVIKDTEDAIELLEIEHANHGTNIDRRLFKYDEKKEEAKREIRRLKAEAVRYEFEVSENEEEAGGDLANDIDSCSLLMSSWSLDSTPGGMEVGKVVDSAPKVMRIGKVVDPALEMVKFGKVVDSTPEKEKRKKENEKIVRAAEKRATADVIGEAVARALRKVSEKEENEERRRRIEEERARVERNRRVVEAIERRGRVVVRKDEEKAKKDEKAAKAAAQKAAIFARKKERMRKAAEKRVAGVVRKGLDDGKVEEPLLEDEDEEDEYETAVSDLEEEDEYEIVRALVYKHMMRVTPELAKEFKSKHCVIPSRLTIKDVIEGHEEKYAGQDSFYSAEEEIEEEEFEAEARAMVFVHLKKVAPGIAKEFKERYAVRTINVGLGEVLRKHEEDRKRSVRYERHKGRVRNVKGESYLLELPAEVMVKVLGLLKAEDIANVSRTCKRLYLITQDPMVWRILLDRDYPEHSTEDYKAAYIAEHVVRMEEERLEALRREEEEEARRREKYWKQEFRPKQGHQCIARWEEDGVWYNAEVLEDYRNGSYALMFVDYENRVGIGGNYWVVWKAEDMVKDCRTLPKEVKRRMIDKHVDIRRFREELRFKKRKKAKVIDTSGRAKGPDKLTTEERIKVVVKGYGAAVKKEEEEGGGKKLEEIRERARVFKECIGEVANVLDGIKAGSWNKSVPDVEDALRELEDALWRAHLYDPEQ